MKKITKKTAVKSQLPLLGFFILILLLIGIIMTVMTVNNPQSVDTRSMAANNKCSGVSGKEDNCGNKTINSIIRKDGNFGVCALVRTEGTKNICRFTTDPTLLCPQFEIADLCQARGNGNCAWNSEADKCTPGSSTTYCNGLTQSACNGVCVWFSCNNSCQPVKTTYSAVCSSFCESMKTKALCLANNDACYWGNEGCKAFSKRSVTPIPTPTPAKPN